MTGERVDVLSAGDGWRVEHISSGRLLEPVDDLLDHDEWVVLLEGVAVLEVGGAPLALSAGEWLRLPPGLAHRVVSTDPGTRWLAVHLPPGHDKTAQ